jgi:Ca2+-binding RTX toxin-like protein
VTLDTTVDFESAGTEGRIPLAALGVLAEQVLALTPPTRTVRPGEVASYTIVVKNPSTSVVDYDLTVEGLPDAWVEILSHVTIPAGNPQALSLTLRTDPLAPLGEHGFAVKASALGIDAAVLGSVVLAGEPVLPNGDVRGVVASLTPGQATAGQGTPAIFTLRVTNVGSVEDTYSISVTAPDGFTTSATPSSVTVPVGVGNFTEVQIAVTPPPGTPVGDVGITALVSSVNGSAFAEASGVVSVTALGVTVALDPPTGPPGSTFQMTVTNTGAVAQTFDLSLGGPAAAASTLGATSVVLAPGASQIVPVNVGPIGFATPGTLDLTGAATARTDTAVKASATVQVTIAETAGVAASFQPSVVILPAPGGTAFLLQVQSTGNKEDTYQATITSTSGPIAASLADLDGLPTQRVPLVRMAGLSGASLVLNATLQAFGQGTVTVRVESLTDPSVMAEATASVQSQSSNTPPIADAGLDQDVPLGVAVALDGTASQDPDGAPQPLTFAWTFVTVPSGSALNDAGIAGAATAQPSFDPDVRGEYVLRLTVSDGSAPDTDEVLVRVVNTAPVAVAGRDRHVATSTAATLDGSDSFDRDGDLITYDWSFESVPSGSGLTAVSIAGRTSPDPSFVPDVAGAYVLKLVVRDQEAASEPSLVTVRAFTANIPPIAHAGTDRHVAVNGPAPLDGRASVDPDAGPAALTFAWTVVATPAGSLITSGDLSGGDQAQASFVPDAAGDYRLALRVGDGAAFSDDEVIVTAHAGNVTPNADAGPNAVAVAGAASTLDGSASVDPDAAPAPLTYRWRFVSLPAGSGLGNDQIVDADLVQARFTPDVVGAYVLELAVFDGAAVDFDNVLVVAQAPGLPICFGRPATIFVRDGLIVGGPDHGKPFRGQLKGTAGDDVIVGTPGNDRIAGNGGHDVICGEDGDDVIDGGAGHDMIDGGGGNDNIRAHGGNDVVLGGDGHDIIETGSGDDEADGGPGDDRIKNQGGRDLLRGGDGHDTLEGGPGNDVMQGGPGRDVIKGQAGNDVIEGGPDDDRIDGGPGQDACADEGANVKNCEG